MGGTGSSNPVPSSGESLTNRWLAGWLRAFVTEPIPASSMTIGTETGVRHISPDLNGPGRSLDGTPAGTYRRPYRYPLASEPRSFKSGDVDETSSAPSSRAMKR
jgi:hypothetical protein